MKKGDPIVIGIVIITLIIISGIFWASLRAQGPSIAQYKITDLDRPKLTLSATNFDFGQMALKETRTKEIELKNTGSKLLIISDVFTSCDCTFAQLVSEGKESPRFSMRRNINWHGEITAGKTALLKITYEPKIMPVQGKVRRTIVFKTNDPANPNVNINFTAEVR